MNSYLIIGAGNVARRVLPLLKGSGPVFTLCRRTEAMPQWRTLGALPILGDLDHPHTLLRLTGLSHTVLHFAPPGPTSQDDTRTRHLLAALGRGTSLPQRLIYISTTGVYGSSAGDWLDETSPVRPHTARARRRVHAETQLRAFGRRTGCRVIILRAPGIYGEHRLPLERLRKGVPLPLENPWTNHIHELDLARSVVAACTLGKSQRVYNVVDDQPLPMGEFYGSLAQHHHLPLPPFLPLCELEKILDPFNLSFLKESRRIHNQRIKQELHLNWCYPSVLSFLK
ncbi:SDR family oxidoreductase [Ferrovum myxofaciens]|jgi:nucleoside-diphosphate-sugar epimerase|uniref:NAD dependent epimerase/dehydratase family protein n=1 Tax=Ferrovum myxofaciens TaxID=416213 RepID=A0A8F3DUL5_9PROT|nr:SDR family oxidoreductase [Ferrovum myxofaciens]KXW58855.1 NAD dependent epimerase/dehydratase family protein [Ferrovum myxofaciens]QKE38715.1 MAG: SDR family oxidoreductase [Ferrovum myxofaciens]QKE41278.1 MAG: SDR family oxidoreductase [Ferrovum myxofaciens]QWY73919.1 MAG: SDR family oxidoreductase [Ferrovum myxofaciens]QWY76672.1 MAG: SDR family oxidoreductase [Ferrovum myxofaciens]